MGHFEDMIKSIPGCAEELERRKQADILSMAKAIFIQHTKPVTEVNNDDVKKIVSDCHRLAEIFYEE